MMQPKTTTLYEEVVRICEEYLGPAGERFIRRQIDTHLGITPEALTKGSLPKLVNWSSMAFAVLTSDPHDVESFTQDMLSLSSVTNK